MGYSVRTDKYRYVGWFKEGSDIPEIEELYYLDQCNIEIQNIIGDAEVENIEKKLKERIIQYKNGAYEEAYK